MHEPAAAADLFHGIFEKLRQLDIAEQVHPDLYEDTDANFWEDYCGDDVSDLVELRRAAGEPGLQVLDLATGTGRIAFALAGAGAEVLGLERSPAMLELAFKARASKTGELAERVSFVQGDMSDFHLARRFDRIVLGATSICLLLKPGDRAGLFACAREHLAPGGQFLFNVLEGDHLGGQCQSDYMDVFTRASAEGQDFAIVGQRLDPASGHFLFNVYRERIAWDGNTVRTLGASVKARIERAEVMTHLANQGLHLISERRDGALANYCVGLPPKSSPEHH